MLLPVLCASQAKHSRRPVSVAQVLDRTLGTSTAVISLTHMEVKAIVSQENNLALRISNRALILLLGSHGFLEADVERIMVLFS